MAKYQVLLPKMGESVSEATIVKWTKQVGDAVEMDDVIVEIATDKVDSEIPSPVSGILVEQLFKEDEVAQMGEVIAILEVEGEDDGDESIEETGGEQEINESVLPVGGEEEQQTEDDQQEVIPGIDLVQEMPKNGGETPQSDRFYSPLVKSIAAEEGISSAELESIQGSGLEGRVTKQDIMNYLSAKRSQKETDPVKPKQVPVEVARPQMKDDIIEMDRMRKLIADHMVNSVKVAPHVCSFVEADVTNIVNWRNKNKMEFEKREGTKITFTPIFIEAVAKAIRDFPMVNISVDGTRIIKKKNINIGMAAALPNGNLIVPVIRNADQLNLVGISKSVNDLAERARTNQLKPDETQDGTFTITNIGSFGNIMGTPIINQPQVAILAIGSITKKPAVIETEYGDVIAIRHQLYLSLSYDHRVVDGALGGMFLRRIADYLEAWDGGVGY